MNMRLSLITSLTFLATLPLWGQGLVPVVYETDSEWIIDFPAGESGYGSQISIVDKSTGILRYYEGYEFPGDPIAEPNWQESSSRIPTNIPSLGVLVGGYFNQLIVPQTSQNKVSFFTPTGYEDSNALYPIGVGPIAGFSFPPVSEQEQMEPVVLIETGLNTPPDNIQHTLFFTEDYEAYDTPQAHDFVTFEKALTFPPLSTKAFDGANVVVALTHEDHLFIGQPFLDDFAINNEQSFPEDGQMFYGNFTRENNFNQLAVYVPGDPNLYLYRLNNVDPKWIFEEPITYELDQPIQMMTRIMHDGKLRIALKYFDDANIYIIDLEEEKVKATLASPGGDNDSALVSMNGDRLLVLNRSDGISVKYELYGENGSGTFEMLFAHKLPDSEFGETPKVGRANVFFFDQSPLSHSGANLLGWSSGDVSVDWASEASINLDSVIYQAWTDAGPDSGLQESFQYNSFALEGSNDVLPNQIDGSSSLVGVGLSPSSDLPLFSTWTPRPGRYDQLYPISVVYPEGTTLYSRSNDNDPWKPYTAPFYPTSDSLDIDFYIESPSGRKSPIQTVSYRFTLSAFNRDSNGDGIPDFVQASLGLDPFGSGDFDEDSSSDLDEIIAETDPTDPNDTPDPGSVIDRGLYQTVELEAHNPSKVSWSPGSTAFIDRINGIRLGLETVDDGEKRAVFANLSVVTPEKLLALATESRFLCVGDDASAPSGYENLGLIAIEPFSPFDFEASYEGGSVEDAAAAWLSALESNWGQARSARAELLNEQSTAFALAFEFALETEFKEKDFLSPAEQLTLFPNRPGDDRWVSIPEIIARTIEENGGAPFTAKDLFNDLLLLETYEATQTSADEWKDWPLFCRELYAMFVEQQVPHTIARNPVDALRALLREQPLPDDLIADLGIDPSSAEDPVNEAQNLRNEGFVRELIQSYSLTVVSSNSDGCFLAKDGASQSYSLFDADGERYVTSKTIEVFPGTKVRVQGVTREDFDACSGTALEVRSLMIQELPQLATADSNGNLLDDNWELFWLGAGDHDPFSSVDGSGYSILQQYLSGTNPKDIADLPEEVAKDLAPPRIHIRMTSPTEITLTWDWPGEYSDYIRFKLIESDDLGNLNAVEPANVDYSRSGDTHTLVITTPATDRRFYKLVLTL